MSIETTPKSLSNYTIKRTYYKTYKYQFQLFIPPITTIYDNKSYNVSSNAILYLALPWPKTTMPFNGNASRSFAIRISNIRRVLRILDRALSWFDSKEYEDMYIFVNEILMLNAKYNTLKVGYRPKYMENQGFSIAPITLEYANGKYQEGVRIYINKIENFMELTVDELRELYDILYQFDFGAEVNQTYIALWHSYMVKNMVDTETHKNRMLHPNT